MKSNPSEPTNNVETPVVPTEPSVNTFSTPNNQSGGDETNLPTEPKAQLTVESVNTVDATKLATKLEEDQKLADKMSARTPIAPSGNANATVSDPYMVKVDARYDVVQNQSDKLLVVPDMKTNDDDMGLVFQPGEIFTLSDFYSPQEINRSKGLRFAATKAEGVNGNFMLVPLSNEEEGAGFVVPKKKQYPKGTIMEDTVPNDFDLRFDELEAKEAKREEKLLRKTLAGKRTKQHGSAPARV